MGWWDCNSDGCLTFGTPDTIGVFGDEPADAVDSAVAQIVAAYERDQKRKPTLAEMEVAARWLVSSYQYELQKVAGQCATCNKTVADIAYRDGVCELCHQRGYYQQVMNGV